MGGPFFSENHFAGKRNICVVSFLIHLLYNKRGGKAVPTSFLFIRSSFTGLDSKMCIRDRV